MGAWVLARPFSFCGLLACYTFLIPHLPFFFVFAAASAKRCAAPTVSQVHRRFREFHALYENLTTANSLIADLRFPSRVTLVESDVRAKRQQKLDVFLKEAYRMCLGNDECLSILYAFLGGEAPLH